MAESSKCSPPRIQRSNVLVRNMDRALRFYCDILGFELEFRKESEPTSYSYPVFGIDRSAKLAFAVLGTPEQPRSLALTEVVGIELEALQVPRRFAVVINVEDIDAILAGTKAAGLTIFEEEKLVTNDGRTGREVGILDPDGNLILVYTIMAKAD